MWRRLAVRAALATNCGPGYELQALARNCGPWLRTAAAGARTGYELRALATNCKGPASCRPLFLRLCTGMAPAQTETTCALRMAQQMIFS